MIETPITGGSLQPTATLLFVWAIVTYVPHPEQTRRWIGRRASSRMRDAKPPRREPLLQLGYHVLLLAIPVWYIHGINAITVTFVVASGALATLRRVQTSAGWEQNGAAIELGCLATVVVLAGLCHDLTTTRHLLTLPITASQLTALYLSGAVALFAIFAGANIVTQVLTEAGTLPELPGEQDAARSASPLVSAEGHALEPLQRAVLRHGAIIGILERFIVVAAVAGSHYDALGFLIAAKGLVRSKELENRARAEYFLVGTLTSMAIAVVCGAAIRQVLQFAWPPPVR